jgi:peptide deformylase
MIKPIRIFPDPVLKKTAAPVEVIDDNTKQIVQDMAETMYDAPGVGLAAPQIGVLQRIIVIDVSGKDQEPELLVAINPVVLRGEGDSFEEEGCLSIPKFAANVHRKASVVVKALNLAGEEITYNAEGLLAIAFQHEIDHLDGILFIDHLSPLKREMFQKKYRRSLEQTAQVRA